jgi:hypothetical protein
MDATSTDTVRTTLLDVLGYVGVALALAGTAIALGDAGLGAQTVAGLVATLALLGSGWLIGAEGATVAQHRMRGIFWFVALQTWSQVVSVLLGPEGADLSGRMLAVVGGLLLAALAIPLWWIERRSLQLIGAFSAVLSVVMGLFYAEEDLFGQAIPHLTWSAAAAAVLGAGMLWLGAAERIHPRRTAMVLGSLTFIIGVLFATLNIVQAAMSGGRFPDLPFVAVLLASVVVLFAGERTGVVAVFGIGVVGMIGAVVVLVGQHATSETDGVLILVLGLVLLAATIFVINGGWRPPAAPAVPPAPMDEPGPPAPPVAPTPPAAPTD